MAVELCKHKLEGCNYNSYKDTWERTYIHTLLSREGLMIKLYHIGIKGNLCSGFSEGQDHSGQIGSQLTENYVVENGTPQVL